MDKLNNFLKSSLAKKGLLKAATSAEICFLADEWSDGLFKTISFANGVLKVSTESSSASSELSMREEALISYLNTKVGKAAVKSIRIVNRG